MRNRLRLDRFVLGALLAAAACSSPASAPDGAAAVTVSPRDVQVAVGGTVELAAVVRDASGNELRGTQVFWASSDTSLAVVSPNGVVQAKRVGTVRVAASASGSSDVATVVVSPQAVAAISLSPTALTLTVGQSGQLSATMTGPGGEALEGRVVSWTSDREGVARVDASGRVTAVGPGVASITATSEGRSASAAVSVSAVPVASVAVSPSSLALTVGQTSTLGATVRDASGSTLSGRAVVWSSSDISVVAVTQTGEVRAAGPGTATVSATSEGVTGTATVSVASPGPVVASVVVSPASVTVKQGGAVTLTAACRDAAGKTLSGQSIGWSLTANREGVASLVVLNATQARVQALKEGTATVTASCGGRSGSATVLVKKD